MALILNPKFNPNDPSSQKFIFGEPTVINSQTGQLNTSMSPVSGEELKPSPNLNITNPPPIPEPDIKNIPVTTPIVSPAPTTTGSDFNKKLEDLTSKLLGKPVAEAKAITEKTAGFEQSLNELNTQIKMHQANALARQEEALKSGETLRFASGTAQNVARTDAIEAMKLSALAQGMQGNILLAEKQAKTAVEAEFGQILQDIQTARQNILDNYDTFTAAEKKRADATLLSLDEKDAFVSQNQEDKKQSYNLSIEAAKNGLTDTKLLTQIQNANPLEAANLAAPYLAEKQKTTFDTFERMVNGEKHTIRQVLDPTGKVISEVDLGAKEGGEVPGKISPTTQSIIDNPSLFDDLTPTKKGTVISELQANNYDTSNLGVKGLSDTAIKEIAQTQKALVDLDELKTIMQENEQFIGPIVGLQRFNPYSKARQVQADINRVKQTVGKALEGGVLRKEDEEKYKKILATLSDTPETAIYKVDALLSSIQRDIENYKNLQQSSGRSLNVRESLQKKGIEIKPEDLRAKYNY